MPHYRNGDQARIGDLVKGPAYNGKQIGIVQSITPGAQTCNMTIGRLLMIYEDDDRRTVLPRHLDMDSVTCADFEKIA